MKKIIYQLIILSTIAVVLSACNKALDKVNNNNNNYSNNVTANNELPQVILGTVESTLGTDLAWYASVYIEHSVGVSNQLFSADQRLTSNNANITNNSWLSIYTNVLVTGMDMINKAKATHSNGYMEGVARILVALNLGTATDLWGDIPFSEAFDIKNLQPKYDKSQDLYDTVIKYLNTAVTLLQLPGQTLLPTAEDYIYGGDKAKWIKAAHSLLARYYLRLGKYSDALNEINSGFANATDAMVFTKFTENQGAWNPWYDFLFNRDYLATSNTLYNLMDAGDPRKNKMFTIPDGSACLDNPIPNDLGFADNNGYCVSEYSYNSSAPMPLMSYHELLFIKAECESRLSIATALQSLKDAITANFIWNGNTATEASTYTGAITAVDISTILKEKYIAQYPSEAIEAYNDYRRTKVVTMHNPLNSTTGFPNFFPYPTSEVASNKNTPSRNVTLVKPFWASSLL